MNNETRMWLEQMRLANPGWRVQLGRNAQPGEGAFAFDCYLYMVDTSTGWIACATMSQAEMRRLQVRAGADATIWAYCVNACASAIVQAGASDAPPESPDAEVCTALAVCSLAQTRTWQLVQEQAGGSLAGHWIYAVYKLQSHGQYLGRPAFVSKPRPGLMEPEDLRSIVRSIVASDLGNPASNVGREVARSGGAVLCDWCDPANPRPQERPRGPSAG
ncbi:MAG: hypothetical protein IPK34_13245 [Ramlibacter sp.]|nr:hypothetical protein [Ramlibacter sp.]